MSDENYYDDDDPTEDVGEEDDDFGYDWIEKKEYEDSLWVRITRESVTVEDALEMLESEKHTRQFIVEKALDETVVLNKLLEELKEKS